MNVHFPHKKTTLQFAAPFVMTIILLLFCISVSSSAALLRRTTLSNGLTVLTYPDARLPILDIAVVCRSGAAEDPVGKEGVAHLVGTLLLRGDSRRNADSVANALDLLGAIASAQTDYDRTSLTLRCLAKDLEQGLDIIANALLYPTFDPKEFERSRTQEILLARRSLDNPRTMVSHTFRRLLFGAHRYALPPNGDTASLNRISHADIVSFHRDHYRPNNCFVIAVGDFDQQRLLTLLEHYFGSWKPASIPSLQHPNINFPSGLQVKLITRPELNQCFIEFGHPGISVSDTDMLAARLLAYILGGNPKSSRLGKSVREERGLAYDVRCWFDRHKLPGAFHATVQTAEPAKALSYMFGAMRELHKSGCTLAELRNAQNYFAGSFPLSYSSNSGKLSQLITQELYQFGDDWLEQFPAEVRKVTLEQVNQAGRHRLSPENCLVVIVGPITKQELHLPGAVLIE